MGGERWVHHEGAKARRVLSPGTGLIEFGYNAGRSDSVAEQDVQRAHRVSFRQHLTKPVDVSQILEALKTLSDLCLVS